MEKITSFRGEYFFLSNFYHQPFKFGGVVYDTAENAFQAQKAPENDREKYAHVKPNAAKSMGRKEKLPEDWELKKTIYMERIIEAKFKIFELGQLLLKTGDAELIEGNTWNDTYWGMNLRTGKGLNKLGEILMELRSWKRWDPETLEEEQRKAAQGDAEAQYNLGRMYKEGRGVEQDNNVATEWFKKSAGQGFGKALEQGQ